MSAQHSDFTALGFNNAVAEALEGRGLTVEQVTTMSVDSVFEHFLCWNGIIGYTGMIRDALDNIRNVEAL